MVTISMSALLAICGAIVSFSAAAGAIAKAVRVIKRPQEIQDEHIDVLNERMDAVHNKLANDNERLDDLETGMQYVLESLFALLAHALDGNDIDKMKDAKDNLNTYLIAKVKK